MRAPFSVKHASGDQKENRPQSGGSWRTFAYLPHRAEAHTTVLSKSVGQRVRACPDADYILAGLGARENGTKVLLSNQSRSL